MSDTGIVKVDSVTAELNQILWGLSEILRRLFQSDKANRDRIAALEVIVTQLQAESYGTRANLAESIDEILKEFPADVPNDTKHPESTNQTRNFHPTKRGNK